MVSGFDRSGTSGAHISRRSCFCFAALKMGAFCFGFCWKEKLPPPSPEPVSVECDLICHFSNSGLI